MKFNKLKVLILGIILVLGISIANYSFAADEFLVFDGQEGTQAVPNGGGTHFLPHIISVDGKNAIFYCINHGGSYNSTLTKEQFDDHYVGEETKTECIHCGGAKPFWTGELRYMKYSYSRTLNVFEHQDEAYILAKATEDGKLEQWEAAFATWASSVSNPCTQVPNLPGEFYRIAKEYSAEGSAYKNFYTNIHSRTTDIFQSQVQDLTVKDDVKVVVNQNEDYYIVGPFNISYPDGKYAGQNKFSWISDIKAVTDVGELPVTVLSSTGAENAVSSYGKDQANSLNGEEFYIKFYSTEATNVKIKMNFGYLEYVYAQLDEYTGQYVYRYWKREIVPNFMDHGYFDEDYGWQPDLHDGERYKLCEEYRESTQVLMALVGTTDKHYGSATLEITPGGTVIDLTMKIEGDVFLDKDTGKVNTGNQKFDNGEALKGVEVTLYDENGNQVTATAYKYHKHEGNSSTYGGCYTQPVYHKHSGSTETLGSCFTIANHTHTGNPLSGGGCYTKPIYHEHEASCYSAPKQMILICEKEEGNLEYYETIYHHHTDECYDSNGNLKCGMENGQEIGTKPIYHVHTKDCYGCKKEEHIHTDDCYDEDEDGDTILICGKEEHIHCKEGQCTIPVHVHTDDCYDEDEDGDTVLTCGKKEHTHCSRLAREIICGKSGVIEEYTLNCGIKITYTQTCGKTEKDIEYYKTSCNKMYDSSYQVPGIQLTDDNGHYIFDNLNSQKKYYIKFVYNGVLYTNVVYDPDNNKDTSKVEEDAQGHTGNRQNFNNVFAEIGSYPSNYIIKNKVFNNELGDYNKVYLQEEIVEIYKNISTNMVNGQSDAKFIQECKETYYKEMYNMVSGRNYYEEKVHDDALMAQIRNNVNNKYNNAEVMRKAQLIVASKETYYKEMYNMVTGRNYYEENVHDDALMAQIKNNVNNRYKNEELMRKVQFAADCRIRAYTVNKYPIPNEFVIDSVPKTIGKTYVPIYSEDYTKDASGKVIGYGRYNQLHVNLGIHARTTFDMALYKDVLKADVVINGKTETYHYDARKQSSSFKLGVSELDYLNGLRGMYQDSRAYTNIQRTSDIERDTYDLNMRSEEVANGQSSNYNSLVTGMVDGNYQVNNNYDNLKLDGANKNDRLKIFVTYKLAIRNQSSVTGAITELVDYFDTNYEFVDAYVGDVDGNKTGNVTKYDNSMYQNSEYKSSKGTYKTIYLRPNEETRLDNGEEQYIYVTLQLLGPENDVGTLLSGKLLNKDTLTVINLAEINGYKTYNSKTDSNAQGLIDIDSNPGNLNISNIDALTQENIVNYPNIRDIYEDDTNRAPALIYKVLESRTIEGVVFEDSTGKTGVATKEDRNGNGKLDEGETGIHGVIVELVEIKNGEMIVRATTKTNEAGWYGFTGFMPGDYVIRYTYGADNDTALTKNSVFEKGLNDKSYNGQDYQSTIFGVKPDSALTTNSYKTDSNLIARYTENAAKRNGEEAIDQITESSKIDRYNSGYYWYTINDSSSDAKDDIFRTNQVINYSKNEYGREITNHKAEVFSAYVNPQPEHITAEVNSTLANELERRAYRYAYTPVIEIEVEYATQNITGNRKHEHKITGVDFGIVERPKQELVIDQDVEHIKVTLADGNVLFDTDKETNNLQWIKGTKFNNGLYDGKDLKDYDKNELINIIMDEELISGANLEITYRLTVTNNSEKDGNATTRAKNILNYVANNLNFDENDIAEIDGKTYRNGDLWKVVSKEDMQNDKKSSFVNNTSVDLSTQSIILQATNDNPLTKTSLAPGEKVETTLKLKKVLATESSSDDLTYTNMTEIVEIDNTVGRYDHGAVPGNQKLELQPMEHDTSGASKYTSFDDYGQPNTKNPPDGTVVVTPPTGSNYIYYVIGITSSLILAVGIFLIKKFVIDKNK